MYKPIDINSKPYNMNYTKKLEYYEKLYQVLYVILLLISLYLVYKYGYKLYYFTLLLLVVYGFTLFPKKIVYLKS